MEFSEPDENFWATKKFFDEIHIQIRLHIQLESVDSSKYRKSDLYIFVVFIWLKFKIQKKNK